VKRHSFPEVQPPPVRRAKVLLKATAELHRSLSRSTFSTSIGGPSEDLVVSLARLEMSLDDLLEMPQLKRFVRNDELAADLRRVVLAVVAAEACFTDPKQLCQAKELAQDCSELQLDLSKLKNVHLLLQKHFLHTAVLRTGRALTFGRDTPQAERRAVEQRVLEDDLERGQYFAPLVSLRDALFKEVTADAMSAYLTHVEKLTQEQRFLNYEARFNAPFASGSGRAERDALVPELEVAGLMGELG